MTRVWVVMTVMLKWDLHGDQTDETDVIILALRAQI